MPELLSQLGIDWHLLLSQAINFFLLLAVLRYFVYKPLLQLLHDRKEKIQTGIMKAEEADRRLVEVDEVTKGKMKDAEAAALAMLKKTEADAKIFGEKLMAGVKQKEAEAMKASEAALRAQEEASRRAMEKEAAMLVRQALIKTVELSPAQVDDALIARAVKEAGSIKS